jgi:1-deoxy-D-xylulose-5-phosphate synthase
VAIYSTFLQRAFDQVVHDCAIQGLHVVFVLDRGGLVGADGATHHGALDLAYLRCIQGMVVMAPKDEQELRNMLYTATEYKGGPIALRYPRGNIQGIPVKEGFESIPIGKSELMRPGKDVAILAIGAVVNEALDAALLLENDRVSAEVVSMRFVKPIDLGMLESIAQRFDSIVTVEDNVVQGGFGSAVLEGLQTIGASHCSVRLHGLPDKFIEQGTPAELYKLCGLDARGIAAVTRDFLTSRHGKSTLEFVSS